MSESRGGSRAVAILVVGICCGVAMWRSLGPPPVLKMLGSQRAEGEPPVFTVVSVSGNATLPHSIPVWQARTRQPEDPAGDAVPTCPKHRCASRE